MSLMTAGRNFSLTLDDLSAHWRPLVAKRILLCVAGEPVRYEMTDNNTVNVLLE